MSLSTISTINKLLLKKNGPPPPSAFEALLIAKPPWGIYKAENWNTGTNTMPDSSPNNRGNVTLISGTVSKSSGSGNGATANIPYISSTNTAKIQWPNGSIPVNFTICSITRYTNTSSGDSNRILASSTNPPLNFVHGHWNKLRGVCFYNYGFYTSTVTKGTLENWLNCCGKNSSSPNNVLIDGVPSGTASGGAGHSTNPLAINVYTPAEPTTNWAFNQVYIWDVVLTDAELVTVSNAFSNYLSTGALY